MDLLQNDVAQVCRGVTGGHQDVHILEWNIKFCVWWQNKAVSQYFDCGNLAWVSSGFLQQHLPHMVQVIHKIPAMKRFFHNNLCSPPPPLLGCVPLDLGTPRQHNPGRLPTTVEVHALEHLVVVQVLVEVLVEGEWVQPFCPRPMVSSWLKHRVSTENRSQTTEYRVHKKMWSTVTQYTHKQASNVLSSSKN